MALKVEKWKSDDGKVYDTEVEALRADAAYWRRMYQSLLGRSVSTLPGSVTGRIVVADTNHGMPTVEIPRRESEPLEPKGGG